MLEDDRQADSEARRAVGRDGSSGKRARAMVGPVLSRRVEIVNRKGLHARAASKLARLAGEFEAEVTVGKDDLAVPATSIMGLMLLTGTQGSSVMLRAHGPAAREAITALSALIANGFDEDD